MARTAPLWRIRDAFVIEAIGYRNPLRCSMETASIEDGYRSGSQHATTARSTPLRRADPPVQSTE